MEMLSRDIVRLWGEIAAIPIQDQATAEGDRNEGGEQNEEEGQEVSKDMHKDLY